MYTISWKVTGVSHLERRLEVTVREDAPFGDGITNGDLLDVTINYVARRIRDKVFEGHVTIGRRMLRDDLSLGEWILERWDAEVSNRPFKNVYRKILDGTWRQIYKKVTGLEMPRQRLEDLYPNYAFENAAAELMAIELSIVQIQRMIKNSLIAPVDRTQLIETLQDAAMQVHHLTPMITGGGKE